LRNGGPAAAEDVSFEIRAPVEGESVLMEGHSLLIRLDPKQEYKMACIVLHGTAPSVDVDLQWKDGTGDRAKILTLTVPS
jgi:hypothetical protein